MSLALWGCPLLSSGSWGQDCALRTRNVWMGHLSCVHSQNSQPSLDTLAPVFMLRLTQEEVCTPVRRTHWGVAHRPFFPFSHSQSPCRSPVLLDRDNPSAWLRRIFLQGHALFTDFRTKRCKHVLGVCVSVYRFVCFISPARGPARKLESSESRGVTRPNVPCVSLNCPLSS